MSENKNYEPTAEQKEAITRVQKRLIDAIEPLTGRKGVVAMELFAYVDLGEGMAHPMRLAYAEDENPEMRVATEKFALECLTGERKPASTEIEVRARKEVH